MNSNWIKVSCAFLIAFMITSCNSGGSCKVDIIPTPNPTPTIVPSPTPIPTLTPSPNPSPEPDPTTTPTIEPSPGAVSFKLIAPQAYPAGMAVTAYLTITNTSNVDAINLQYPMITPTTLGNTTGVAITLNPQGVSGNDCSTILKGQSCVFTAAISQGSAPGGFIVTVMGDSEDKTSSFISRIINLGSTFTVEAKVGISLVDILPNSNELYILPSNQTLNMSMVESINVMFSVLVESGNPSTITLHDGNNHIINNATLLSPSPLGNSYQVNDIATYSISYPPGQNQTESIVAVSNLCESECSNIAMVNFVSKGSGILSISPATTTFSESDVSQVFTLINTGESIVNNIILPMISEPLKMSSNCGGESAYLNIESSCTFTITYTESYVSGIRNYQVNYNNGLNNIQQAVPFSIYFVRVPLSLIFVTDNTYNGNLNGIAGADSICQNEAYSNGSIIPTGLTFKALLVTSTRYPCDATGQCGGEHASNNWPLVAGEVYFNPDLSHFNTVNDSFVFDGSKRSFQSANGDDIPNYEYLWTGIQSIKSNTNIKDISAWAYADVNPTADSNRYTSYSPATCSDFTNSVNQPDVLLASGSAGQTGIRAKATNRDHTILANTWGNYYIFDDNSGVDNIVNTWMQGILACSVQARLVCVSAR